MTNCDQCGKSYPEKTTNKFCIQCGSKLVKQEMMKCIHCTSIVIEARVCSVCSEVYSQTELELMKEIRNLKSDVKRLKETVGIEFNEQIQPVYAEIKEKSRQKMAIEEMDFQETTQSVEARERPTEPEVADELDLIEDPAIIASQQIVPKITTPELFVPKFDYQPEIHPIEIPELSQNKLKIKNQTFSQRMAELIEGPLLIVIGVFTAIMSMIYTAQVLQWSSSAQGTIFSVVGILFLISGYLMTEGKLPLIGPERGLGILVSITGYLLANIFTLNTENLYLILSIHILTGGILAYFCIKIKSELMASVFVVLTTLFPIILINSGTYDNLIVQIFSFGGGLIWILPSVVIAAKMGLDEDGFYPSLIIFGLGSILGYGLIFGGSKFVYLPALGILASLIPTLILVRNTKLLLIDFYYQVVIVLMAVFPPFAYILTNIGLETYDVENWIINDVIFLLGFSISLTFMFDTTIDEIPVLKEIRATIGKYIDKILYVTAGFAVYSFTGSGGESELISIIAVIGMIIVLMYLPEVNPKLNENKSILQTIYFSLLASFTFNVFSNLGYNDDQFRLYSSIIIGLAISIATLFLVKYQYHPRVTNRSFSYPIIFSICLLLLSTGYNVIDQGLSLSLPMLFLSTFLISEMEDKDRIIINNSLLLGLTTAISYIIISLNSNISVGNFSNFSVIYSFIFFSITSSLALHLFRLRKRVKFEFSNDSFTKRLYKFTLDNQEVVLNFSIHTILFFLLFIVQNLANITILVAIVSIITIGTLYVARKGHWISIIPPLVTTTFVATFGFNIFLTLIISSYIVSSLGLNYLDRSSGIKRNRIRIFLRDISVWVSISIIVMLNSELVILSFIIVGIGLLHSLGSDIMRKNNPITGLTLIFGPIALFKLTLNPIFGYLSYYTIILGLLFYLIQDQMIEDISFELNQISWIKNFVGHLIGDKSETIDNFKSIRFIFPVLGFTILSFTAGIQITPYIMMALIAIITSFALIINKSKNIILLPINLIFLINFSLFVPQNFNDYISIIIILASLGITIGYAEIDKVSFLPMISYTLLSGVIGYFVLNASVFQITSILIVSSILAWYLFKDNSSKMNNIPLISFILTLEVVSGLDNYEFIFPLVLIGLSLINFIKSNKIEDYADLPIAISFAIYVVIEQSWLTSSNLLPIMIGVSVFALNLVQYYQEKSESWIISLGVLTIPVIFVQTIIKEWLLLTHVGIMAIVLFTTLRNKETSKRTKFLPYLLALHILLFREVSLVFTILVIICSMLYYYSVKPVENYESELPFVVIIFGIVISISSNLNQENYIYKIIPLYLILSLYLYRMSKVSLADDNTKGIRSIGLIAFFFANLTISNFDIFITNFQQYTILVLLALTSLALSYYIWSSSSDFVLNTITIITLSASVPILPELGSIVVLSVIMFNIAYMAISVLSGINEIKISELSIFGISYFILGTIQSYFGYINNLNSELMMIFDISWIVTYLVWLGSALLLIYQSSITIKIFNTMELDMNSMTDMIFILLMGHGIVMLGWSNLASISVLVLLSIIIGVGSLIVIISNPLISIEKTKPIDLLYIGFFINVLTTLVASANQDFQFGNMSIEGVILVTLFSLLPLIFGLIIYTNRGYRKLDLEQINTERLYLFLALAVLISVIFIEYRIDQVPIVIFAMAMFTWCILLIGAWNNEVLVTTVGTIFVYVAAYILGNDYQTHIADAEFAASIPIVIFIAIVVVLYLFRAELELRFQLGHHPLLIVSIAALIFTSFQVDNLRLIGSSISVATTIVTVLFSFVGALTYIYGTKFARGRYKGLGVTLILLNMVRGLSLFFSRIAGLQGSTEGNPLLSLISFLWAFFMILVVGGVRSLSKRENMNRILATIFTPIQRDESEELI